MKVELQFRPEKSAIEREDGWETIHVTIRGSPPQVDDIRKRIKKHMARKGWIER